MAEDPKRPRSHWGDAERVAVGRKTPPRGMAVPNEFICEPATGVLSGDELRSARERRSTPERLWRVEERQDSHDAKLSETREDVREIKTKQEAHGDLLTEIRDDLRKQRDEERADAADAKRNNRERITKIIGWVFSGGLATYILHRLGAL